MTFEKFPAAAVWTATIVGIFGVAVLSVELIVLFIYVCKRYSGYGIEHSIGNNAPRQTSKRSKSKSGSAAASSQSEQSPQPATRGRTTSTGVLEPRQSCLERCREDSSRRIFVLAFGVLLFNIAYNVFFAGVLYDTLSPTREFTQRYCVTNYLTMFSLYAIARILLVWFFIERVRIVFANSAFAYERRTMVSLRVLSAILFLGFAAHLNYWLAKYADPDHTSDNKQTFCIPSPKEWTPGVHNIGLYAALFLWTSNDNVWNVVVIYLFASRLLTFLKAIDTGDNSDRQSQIEKSTLSAHKREMLNVISKSFVLAVVAIFSTFFLCISTAALSEFTYFAGFDGVINSTCVVCLFPPFEMVYKSIFRPCEEPTMNFFHNNCSNGFLCCSCGATHDTDSNTDNDADNDANSDGFDSDAIDSDAGKCDGKAKAVKGNDIVLRVMTDTAELADNTKQSIQNSAAIIYNDGRCESVISADSAVSVNVVSK